MQPHLIALGPDRVGDCARIAASLPLYRSYGLTEERAGEALDAARLATRTEILVAVQDGQTLGFAWFVRRGAFDRSGYLKQIAVATPGAGVGERLLSALEGRYRTEGGIVLMVTATNHGARRFYERRGYHLVGEISQYAHADHDECIYYLGPKD